MKINTRKMKLLREKRKLTQGQATRRAGMAYSQHWSAIERGRRSPCGDTLVAMAKALRCKVDDLLEK